MNTEDREAMTRIVNQHGHLIDTGRLDRLHEIFTADVAYDVSDFGGGVITGLEAMRAWVLDLGDRNPVAHHVTNVVLDEITDGVVHCLSKGIGIGVDGTARSVTFEDRFERSEAGWRISRRVVKARRAPLRP
ncbi:nuclear transport factor 2 family protein [Amycolatopsis saalfeldensis]|uniref:SnoaL-like domain-containing protein n=1 Tax=Amycolatopsis saalfeldensis TaxID=394193 RepID=A0A1H8VH90_9PSEU|nr:nuclear transport factor 2 family protein [Amycolatopsis saalfeldensis]SEP14822.1 SnoaL-like domain-containing protein [Amycolatopsis saalfeldensis]